MTTGELQKLLEYFLAGLASNRIPEFGDIVIFDPPLVAFASAEDPLFLKYKEPDVVGPNHLSPGEWLSGARTVISWFLPFSAQIRTSNAACEGLPSREWVYGRYEGEMVNDSVRWFLADEIGNLGGRAVVPPHDPRYRVENRRSGWSERHAAFAAGLGTFSLSRSLITEKGCAGRYGSVITDLPLDPNLRPYQGVEDYCNQCGDCIRRCPAGAIKPEGKDIVRCAEYQDREIKPRFLPRYGCGKCQTGVSCETAIPRYAQNGGNA